eukprot:10331875-Prorocentrum_lima.AAC.1
MEPAELQALGWPQSLAGTCTMASTWTCLTAQNRRILDYFVLSPLLVGMVAHTRVLQDSLTRPHRP